jgi:hypothetical protein
MRIPTVFKIALISGTTTALLALAASAHAEVITAEYTATFSNPVSGMGMVLDGRYTFDSGAVGTLMPAGDMVYPATSHTITLRVGDGPPTICEVAGSRILVSDDRPFGLTRVLDQYIVGAPVSCSFDSLPLIHHALTFVSIGGSPHPVLTSKNLPLTNEDLSGFSTSERTVRTEFMLSDGQRVQVEGSVTSFEILNEEAAPVFACDGFFPPFDGPIGLSRKERRVIPLRLEILDDQDFGLGPDDIAAPIVSVRRSATVIDEDLDALVDSPGRATSGNQFMWNETEQQWEYNLATAPFSAAGTYSVTALAGDEKYGLDPTCGGVFVRQ